MAGYTDTDWAGSDEEMRSISRSCFTLGSGVITWHSKRQTIVAQSTAEAEYVAAAKSTNQAVRLRKVMADVKSAQTRPTILLCDNKAAIAIVTTRPTAVVLGLRVWSCTRPRCRTHDLPTPCSGFLPSPHSNLGPPG